ncbi:hypothetical protein HHI36_008549 [Cryptolaemus montrouzieri]|uniref:PiggyBac transposable element-derived protein domain-containing protein n=1 Tax=Cryptolaemus montrouzieri TaxID=559131 RepID=A0ABD2MSX3_9CUCU
MSHIKDESCKYASQKSKQFQLETFFAILIIMGFHALPSMRLYWSVNNNTRVDRVANIMSQKRFLHLNDNEKMPKRDLSEFDKMYKLATYSSSKFLCAKKPKKDQGGSLTIQNMVRKIDVETHLPIKGIYRQCPKCSTKKKPVRSRITCEA